MNVIYDADDDYDNGDDDDGDGDGDGDGESLELGWWTSSEGRNLTVNPNNNNHKSHLLLLPFFVGGPAVSSSTKIRFLSNRFFSP